MRVDAAWRSLLIASLTMTVHTGVLLTFPVVYVALLEEFGWGRGEGAGIFALTTLVIGLAGPLVGTLLDSLGPQRLFVGWALVTAAGMAATGLGTSLPFFYATYGMLTGLGHGALGSVPNMVVVSKWFPQATGRAIALADTGTALGVLLIVPVTQWVILQAGWRVTLWALAAFIVLALAIFVLLYGLSQGSSGIVVAARAADLFQGTHFGRIYGWISISSGAGEALGAWLGGAVYDLTGSYRTAFATAVVALAGGAACLWLTYVGEFATRPKRA